MGGDNEAARLLKGFGLVTLDIAKVVLMPWAVALWFTRARCAAAACAFSWAVLTGLSIWSVMAIESIGRDRVGVAAINSQARATALQSDLNRRERELSWIADARPIEVVQAALRSIDWDTRRDNSSNCAAPKTPGERSYFASREQLVAELSAARRAEVVRAEIDKLRAAQDATPPAQAAHSEIMRKRPAEAALFRG